MPSLARRFRTLFALAVCAALPAAAVHAHDAAPRRLVGYFTQWGIYGKGYVVKNVEDSGAARRLTHIQYAFANVTPDLKCGITDAWADYQKTFPASQNLDGVDETWSDTELRGNFNQLRKLKQRHPGLKVLISVGGWSYSNRFSDAALTEESRQAFAASCVDTFVKGNVAPGISAAGVFDGIDIDWEYPGACGNTCDFRPEDTQNFTLLLAELRKQLDAAGHAAGKRYELAIATSVGEGNFSKIELRKAARYVDFMSLMAYDIHGGWEMTTNFHAPLLGSSADPAGPKANADFAVRSYLRAGVPADKVVLGVPFYGRGWSGVPEAHHGLYQSATGLPDGVWEAGVNDYRDLAPLAAVQGSFRDLRSQGQWTYAPTTGIFWGFDDPLVMGVKAGYTRLLGLGGVMFWELSGDSADGALVRTLGAVLNPR
jgi:chitinase